MDNITQQADEIEALRSIYENELVQENGDSSYSFQVTPNVKLYFSLHPNYPSENPPDYDLLAPELSSEEKSIIHSNFSDIFKDNMGNPVLFQWIEKLKEIVFSRTKKADQNRSLQEVAKIDKEQIVNTEVFNLEVVHGPIIEDRKSVFQGHICGVTSEADVKNFLQFLMENKKIAQATHNIYAYRMRKNSLLLQDCDDDGETHASKRILKLLEILNLENVMVVVSRWYGGIQLGPDRFKHINNSARQALEQAGFIK